MGSPPRLRGQRQQQRHLASWQGITPALAGTTRLGQSPNRQSWDHPRACGDNRANGFVGGDVTGSPPRLRGQRITKQRSDLNVGITPALAGTTSIPRSSAIAFRDHPRACGDNKMSTLSSSLTSGSPPRLRGQRFVSCFHSCTSRITPALAGTTEGLPIKVAYNRDHPRACGDNDNAIVKAPSKLGSPPRLRGQH